MANHFNCRKAPILSCLITYVFYLVSQGILPIYLIGLTYFLFTLLKLTYNKNYFIDISIIIIGLIFYFYLHSHMFSKVNNIFVAQNIIIGKKGIPWNLYINHDKALISFIALLNIYCISNNKKKDYLTILAILLFGFIFLIFLSLIFGFIKYDFKIVPILWLWGINNLFMVCVAEEVFFRLFLYNRFEKITNFSKYKKLYSLLISSLLFGLFHYSGGIIYIYYYLFL